MKFVSSLFVATCIASIGMASALLSFEQLLVKHHIGLTKNALIDALQNSDPEVRWLAASKLLLNDRAVDTVPLVEEAVRTESVPGARMNIAFALAQIGDSVGIAALQGTCDDSNVAMSTRLKAAGYLIQIDRGACLSAINEALRPERDDVVSQIQALSLVPSIKRLSLEASEVLTHLVLENLKGKQSAVRLNASHALAALRTTAGIPELRLALSIETDDTTLRAMERDLARIDGGAR